MLLLRRTGSFGGHATGGLFAPVLVAVAVALIFAGTARADDLLSPVTNTVSEVDASSATEPATTTTSNTTTTLTEPVTKTTSEPTAATKTATTSEPTTTATKTVEQTAPVTETAPVEKTTSVTEVAPTNKVAKTTEAAVDVIDPSKAVDSVTGSTGGVVGNVADLESAVDNTLPRLGDEVQKTARPLVDDVQTTVVHVTDTVDKTVAPITKTVDEAIAPAEDVAGTVTGSLDLLARTTEDVVASTTTTIGAAAGPLIGLPDVLAPTTTTSWSGPVPVAADDAGWSDTSGPAVRSAPSRTIDAEGQSTTGFQSPPPWVTWPLEATAQPASAATGRRPSIAPLGRSNPDSSHFANTTASPAAGVASGLLAALVALLVVATPALGRKLRRTPDLAWSPAFISLLDHPG